MSHTKTNSFKIYRSKSFSTRKFRSWRNFIEDKSGIFFSIDLPFAFLIFSIVSSEDIEWVSSITVPLSVCDLLRIYLLVCFSPNHLLERYLRISRNRSNGSAVVDTKKQLLRKNFCNFQGTRTISPYPWPYFLEFSYCISRDLSTTISLRTIVKLTILFKLVEKWI
jgi:hypothetical protein